MTTLMRNRLDLHGRQFGRLVVVGLAGHRKGMTDWLAICSCGAEVTIRGSSLTSGNTTSCGCLKRELRRTHGHTTVDAGRSTPEYRAWSSMKGRCLNRRNANYPRYGGRGITVCDRWRDSFDAFMADMGVRPSRVQSIERKDNALGYSPGNCCWATVTDQTRNRRSRKLNTEAVKVIRFVSRRGLRSQPHLGTLHRVHPSMVSKILSEVEWRAEQ